MDDGLKILLIDDDAVDRMAVRRALRAVGVTAAVREASDGAEGLAAMRAEAFDCVLLDYRLPDRDGLAVLREARAGGVTAPIILLTGQGDEELAVEIMKAGASDYLTKSRVSLDHLEQSVRSAVRLHRAEREAVLATQRMADSEERYRSLVYATSQVVWTTDANGQVTTPSASWLAFTGQAEADVLGMGWVDAVHPDDRDRMRAAWLQAVEARAPYGIECRLRRADGAHRHVVIRAAPVLGPAGGVVREWVGTCTDITERIEAELERARLLEHERVARESAEAATHRLAFLAEASKVLAASLNYEEALGAVTRLAVPRIADWCVVDLVVTTPDRPLHRVAFHHADPSKVRASREMQAHYPPRGTDAHGPGHVVVTGVPELYPDVQDAVLAVLAQDERHLGMMRSLGARSAMVVPLAARGHVLGAMTFVAAESGRRFAAADLALAEDVARRAAVAVDNARLYRSVQDALASKDEAHTLLDTLLATAPIGMGFFDRDLRYVRINDALAAINGIPAQDHLGRTPAELLPEMSSQVMEQLGEVLRTGREIVNVDVRGGTPADPGQMHDFLVSYYPVRSRGGELIGVGATVVDITDRKRAEVELKRAKEAAESANRAKDQFMAVLSHELRTPLTPVLAAVQEFDQDPRLSRDLREAAQMIRRNVELEARLIDDLLDLTRISKGKMRLTVGAVDAHDLLNSVMEICEPDAVAKGLRVDVALGATSPYVRADSARMQQILWNLLKNAVKFTPAGGRISVETLDDGDGGLTVRVSDTGIGIEPDVLPRIFDAFEQGEQSVTRVFGGLGLGLAITRALVDAHGGTLRASSAGKGRGATFTLTLPTVPAPVESAQPAADQAGANGHDESPALRILLVDDHEDTNRAMKRLLERIGHEVRTASSVAGALQAADGEPFDLLISDIGLPDGSGLDLVRELNQRIARGQSVKAIALSGFGMEEDLQKSREAGFMEHLTKPVTFQQLEGAIRQLTARG